MLSEIFVTLKHKLYSIICNAFSPYFSESSTSSDRQSGGRGGGGLKPTVKVALFLFDIVVKNNHPWLRGPPLRDPPILVSGPAREEVGPFEPLNGSAFLLASA
jgi:hypothetical protein